MRAATVAITIKPPSRTTRRSRYSGEVEVPDERGQDAHQGEREQRGRRHALPVHLGVAQTQRFEGFDLQRTDHLAVANDGLPARVGLLDRCHRLARVLLGLGRRVGVHHLVRHHEALDQLDDHGAVGIRKERRHAQGDVVADFVDIAVGNAVLHDVLQDALGLVGDGGPVIVVERGERARGGIAEWWRHQLGHGLLLDVWITFRGVTPHDVDGLDQVGQATRLLGDHVAIQLDDWRHLGGGGVTRLAGADLADVGHRAGRFDRDCRDVTLLDVVHPREQVNAEDYGEQ